MADNLIVTAKIGETGKVVSVILKETNATTGLLAPKDLTGYTNVLMQVEKSNGTVVMNQVPCVITNALTGEITCTTDITVALHPGLIKGDHQLEFSGLNAAGKKRYWPVNKNESRTYGRMIIQAALS